MNALALLDESTNHFNESAEETRQTELVFNKKTKGLKTKEYVFANAILNYIHGKPWTDVKLAGIVDPKRVRLVCCMDFGVRRNKEEIN